MSGKKTKVRLDVLAVERGLLPSRQAAQAAIIDGGVLVDGVKIDKPGTPVSTDVQLTLTKDWQPGKYVSRGGLKLEKALTEFGTDVSGRTCLDVGASTGGFTDCLLQHGARHVYAIDVGYGQLDWRLRQNEKVTVKERMNARYMTADQLYGDAKPWADFAVFDVSFISLTKVLPGCIALLESPCDLIALVKPQFEAGRAEVGKGGVVRSAKTHEAVLKEVIAASAQHGLLAAALTHSPVKGPSGNIEFLLLLQQPRAGLATVAESDVTWAVEQAHALLS
jgi:23S rRNA (cytidine1920-2'-O)/16S rRNA (cytidine1409-2'-O)-methyltransferase